MKLLRLMMVIASLKAHFVKAQFFTTEVMTGNKSYYYQHSFGLTFPQSRFGFFNTSSLHLLHDEKTKNELMSQQYITYPLGSHVKLALGTFYATKPGISPALALQFKYNLRHTNLLFAPRVDLKKNGAIEAMAMVEYLPPINYRLTFYSRAQLMSNYGPNHHNRSYQNFRIGLKMQKAIFGLALNIDERGREIQTLRNWGLFFRYDY